MFIMTTVVHERENSHSHPELPYDCKLELTVSRLLADAGIVSYL